MRRETLDYVQRLETVDYPDYVTQLLLFGSEAYGIPEVGSDIDFAVVSKAPLKTRERIIVDEILDFVEPPYEYQAVFVTEGSEYEKSDIRCVIFERGLMIYECGNVSIDC